MNIKTLCNLINLEPEIKNKVLSFFDGFDFSAVEEYLSLFKDYLMMDTALKELRETLGEDIDNIKILSCELKASSNIYDFYKIKGIPDEIYIETMKCYTRFIKETYQMTGKLYYDRFWWTTRQAGGHLFRIGALEYEITPNNIIEIHIPSDSDFSPSSVDESIKSSIDFFKKYFPELKIKEYQCHSWLLDNNLQKMLKEDSNILSFQRRFEIIDEGEKDDSIIEWLFQTKSHDYTNLKEDTYLQRNVKKYLLSGGVIKSSSGRLKI